MSKVWDFYGAQDPYYGVLSAPEFHADRMSDDAKERFFASGVTDADRYISIAQQAFGPLRFDTALDYGCGVGRLSRRLADRFSRVIAVDISDGMLSTARANLSDRNISFESANSMSGEETHFILSQMVFQHIPQDEGLQIIPMLVARLRGTGIIEMPIRDKASSLRRAARVVKRTAKAAMRTQRPTIPMYIYDPTAVIGLLEGAGCRVQSIRFISPLFENLLVIFHRG